MRWWAALGQAAAHRGCSAAFLAPSWGVAAGMHRGMAAETARLTPPFPSPLPVSPCSCEPAARDFCDGWLHWPGSLRPGQGVPRDSGCESGLLIC